MIEETIKAIEEKIRKADSITNENRGELLNLLSELKSEIADLSDASAEDLQSIVGFTQLSTHEATREQKNPGLLELSLKGLSSSVAGFEESHPKLVATVNSICLALSNLGI